MNDPKITEKLSALQPIAVQVSQFLQTQVDQKRITGYEADGFLMHLERSMKEVAQNLVTQKGGENDASS